MQGRVSVVVSNHNYGRFVGTAVDSVLAQTHPDVELVVVDDGSTDDSRAVLRGYGDRIVLVEQDNLGQATACTRGFARTTGRAVLFLDADDWLRPQALEIAMAALSPGDAKVQFRLDVVDDAGAPTGRTHPSRHEPVFYRSVLAELLEHGRYPSAMTSGNLYPRDVLARVLPIPAQEYRNIADGYLNAAVVFDGPVRFVDDVLGCYRLHSANRWSVAQLDPQRLRDGIAHDRNVHRLLGELAAQHRVRIRPDLELRDEYHLRQRIGSLRLDPQAHPQRADGRLLLAWAGVRAALPGNQPRGVRLRNAAWFVLVALAPRQLVARLVPRAVGAR